MTVWNIDADPRDADWIKTGGWDLPTDPARFLTVIGGRARLGAFMRRPAAEAMPASLRAALGIPAVRKYSEDEARDDRGRWASSGSEATVEEADANTRAALAREEDLYSRVPNLRDFGLDRRAEYEQAVADHMAAAEAAHAAAERSALRSDELSARKYSPDQPRDERGRFGSGGYGADPFGGRSEMAASMVPIIRNSPAVIASHDWPTTKPWQASIADIRAGRFPELRAADLGVGTGNDVMASVHGIDKPIVINSRTWDDLTIDRRAAILYHELGHMVTESALADPKANAALMTGRTPFERSAWGSLANNIDPTGEELAVMYAEHATSAPKMDYDLVYNEQTHGSDRIDFPEARDAAARALLGAESAYVGAPVGTQIVLYGPNKTDLSKVSTATLLAMRDTLAKYSEDEARDEGGRWTAGGGIASAVADYQTRHPGNNLLEGVPPDRVATMQSVLREQGVPDVIPSVGPKFAAGADPERGAMALRTLDELQSRFGVGVDQVELYDFSKGWMASPTPASIGAQVKGSNVYLNTMYFGEHPGAFRATDNVGWLADHSLTGILYHEYAHILDRSLSGGFGNAADPAYQSWRSAYLASGERPSGYARAGAPGTTQEERDAEAVAEAFTAAFSPGAKAYGGQQWVDALRGVIGGGATARKYSEDEARDDHGRWTAGGAAASLLTNGFSPSEYSPGYNPADRRDGVFSPDDALFWTAASDARLAAIRATADVPGTIGSNMLDALRANRDRGVATTDPVYRGVRLDRAPGTGDGRSLRDYRVGERVTLPLTSFTASRDTALLYARSEPGIAEGQDEGKTNRAWAGGGSASAVIELAPGATTLTTGDAALSEHVTAGQFTVTGVRSQWASLTQSGIEYTGLVTVIQVRQASIPGASAHKYSPDQPRDDHGRWSADGAGLDDAMPKGWTTDERGMLRDERGNIRGPSAAQRIQNQTDIRAIREAVPADRNTAYALQPLSALDASASLPAVRTLVRLQGEFPSVPLHLVSTGTTTETAAAQYFPADKAIRFAAPYWTQTADEMIAGYMSNPGWVTAGTPEGIAAHEFGHAVGDAINDRLGAYAIIPYVNSGAITLNMDGTIRSVADPAAQGVADMHQFLHGYTDTPPAGPDGALAKYMMDFRAQAPVSGYAATKPGYDPMSENFAEVFAAAFTPSSVEYNEPYAQAMRDAMRASGMWQPSAVKVEFFTEDGVVHPIRGSDGYDESLARGAGPSGDSGKDPKGDRLTWAERLSMAPSLDTATWDKKQLEGLSYTDALEAVRGIRGVSERAVFFDGSGAAVFAKGEAVLNPAPGTAGAVNFTDEERAAMADQTLVHNHPSGWDYPADNPMHAGNSFSMDDIYLAVRANLAAIVATTPTQTFSLVRPDSGWLPVDKTLTDLTLDYAKIVGDVRREIGAKIADGSMTIPEANAAHYNEINSRLAKMYGWGYTVRKAPA